MANNLCPNCGATFPNSVVNVVDGAILCPKCGTNVPPIEINITRESIEKLLRKNLNGCTITDHGKHVTIEASTRSVGDFIAMLFICLFCNGIILTLNVGFAFETYFQLFGNRPTWFHEMQWEDGSKTGNLFLLFWPLLIFMAAAGAGIVWLMILYLRGKNTIELHNDKAIIWTGFGRFRLREEFKPDRVTCISLEYPDSESTTKHIVIHAERAVTFGSALTVARQEWLESVLKYIFLSEDETKEASFLERAKHLAATINGPRVPPLQWSESV